MTITVDSMRGKLLQLDDVREVLAQSEPMEEIWFTVGDQVRFDAANGWEFGIEAKSDADQVDVWITIGGGKGKRSYILTKEALFQATTYMGMRSNYACRLPAALIVPHLNYFYREGLKHYSGSHVRDFKLLVLGGIGSAVTRKESETFSNLAMLDHVLDGIRARFGSDAEVLVDPKFHHTIAQSYLRLILPGHARMITGTGTDDDQWSVGVQVKNSLTGRGRTAVDGYLFRWTCANGAIDVRNPAGGVWVRKRRIAGDEMLAWTRATVDNILMHLDASLEAVQNMVAVPIAGHASDVLRDVFTYYRVRLHDRTKIINLMAQADTLTMYTVMQAVTEVASSGGLDPVNSENLMRLGGDLPYASSSQCSACRRLSHVH